MMAAGALERIATPAGHSLAISRREGTGRPVLFLNSIGADHTMWDGVRDRIERPSVAFDARGHGASDVTPGRVGLGDLAADAIAVMDFAGLDRAVICGLSLGGPTAIQVAAEVPDRVAGLVLANTATSFGSAERWRDRAAALRSGGLPDMIGPTLERWLSKGWRDAHPDETGRIAEMIARTPPEGYAAACAALEEADMAEALSAWTGATLVIAGTDDRSTPVARSEEMVRIAASAELVVLDTAHISALEDPDGFAAALDHFASGLDAAG